MSKKSGQSEYASKSGSQLSLDGKRFFPVGLNLEGRHVLVVAGSSQALNHIQGLMEFGAMIDVVADRAQAELKELALSCSHKITLLEISIADLLAKVLDLKKYTMVLAFSHSFETNEKIALLARESGVLVTEGALKKDNDFCIPTWFRRGQIKIAVATDGISGALEKALITRIRATFVREMDHYALFADFVLEKLKLAHDDQRNEAILGSVLTRVINSEDVCLALQRNNWDEAEHLFEQELQHVLSEAMNRTD